MCLKFALEAVGEQSFNEEEVQPASNLFTEERHQGYVRDWWYDRAHVKNGRPSKIDKY